MKYFQKQPLNVFYEKRCAYKFRKIHRKTIILEFPFNKIVFSPLLNISSASFSCSLNRLNALSPYEKFVLIENAYNASSCFI